MMKERLVFLFGLLLLLDSCVSIQSNVRPGYSPDIKRMYIILYSEANAMVSQTYLANFGKRLELEFAKYKIDSKAHVFDDMAPGDKSEMMRERDSLSPDMEMSIIGTTFTFSNGVPSSVAFGLKMVDLGDSTCVWKARFEITAATMNDPPQEVVRVLFDQLVKDGILKAKSNTTARYY
jgi:hypothetical protein